MSSQWWPEPTAGEIVWCHFPDAINPRPKPRPALIVAVFDEDAPEFAVRIAYGTSQCTTTLHRGEFAILRDRNPAAYEAAGLSYDTKFDLRQTLDLPYTTEWFTVPPAAPHGQTPETRHTPSFVGACSAGGVSGVEWPVNQSYATDLRDRMLRQQSANCGHYRHCRAYAEFLADFSGDSFNFA